VDSLATISVNSSPAHRARQYSSHVSPDLLLCAPRTPIHQSHTASDVHLFILHTDASFRRWIRTQLQDRAVYTLGNKAAPGARPQPRHPILVTSVILPTVAANVAEQMGLAPSCSTEAAVPLQQYIICTLPQPTTDVITDNAPLASTDTISRNAHAQLIFTSTGFVIKFVLGACGALGRAPKNLALSDKA
jgi:hypothetical protein